MKHITKLIAVAAVAGLVATSPAFAGTGKSLKEEVTVVEPTKWWGAALSTGWDSLYMFRGVNVLGSTNNPYGSSLYWTNLSLSFNLTESDVITLGSWFATGLTRNAYKELDISVAYTHSWGNLSLTLGYIYYYVISPTALFSHELSAGLGYTFDFGAFSITPSLTYFFNLGPQVGDDSGIAEQLSSYLQAKIVADIPIYKEAVSLAPWVALGTNFRYNFRTYDDGGVAPFIGTNNLELGLAIPWAVNDIITVSVYGAYSYQWYGLIGTDPSTFWGGANVTFSF
ncbi:MAG TPA: hypothetical protein VIS74_01350 [Chthoniobacterales bacterium]